MKFPPKSFANFSDSRDFAGGINSDVLIQIPGNLAPNLIHANFDGSDSESRQAESPMTTLGSAPTTPVLIPEFKSGHSQSSLFLSRLKEEQILIDPVSWYMN